nr:MAG: hypothetical protein [uncultured archaeon]
MAEEFAEFMKDLNDKPIEEQLTELKQTLSKLVDIIVKFIDNYTIELEILHNKIITLETKDIDISDIVALTPIPTPPPPQHRPIGKEGVRVAVLGELKGIFLKHKEMSELKE